MACRAFGESDSIGLWRTIFRINDSRSKDFSDLSKMNHFYHLLSIQLAPAIIVQPFATYPFSFTDVIRTGQACHLKKIQ